MDRRTPLTNALHLRLCHHVTTSSTPISAKKPARPHCHNGQARVLCAAAVVMPAHKLGTQISHKTRLTTPCRVADVRLMASRAAESSMPHSLFAITCSDVNGLVCSLDATWLFQMLIAHCALHTVHHDSSLLTNDTLGLALFPARALTLSTFLCCLPNHLVTHSGFRNRTPVENAKVSRLYFIIPDDRPVAQRAITIRESVSWVAVSVDLVMMVVPTAGTHRDSVRAVACSGSLFPLAD